MSEYNFTKFESRGSKFGSYHISVNKSKSLGLLSGFYSKEGIKNYRRANLFFDKKKKAIAIGFTNDEKAPSTFKITHNGGGNNSASISALSFFAAHEIMRHDAYFGRKIPKKIRDDHFGTLYVIDLQQ